MTCLRHYPLTLSAVLVVTIMCLIPIEDPPLKDVRFIDKWTHIVLFGGICAVCLLEKWNTGRRKSASGATPPDTVSSRGTWLVPIAASLYGGLVELMQAYLTTCRTGDWLDFAADSVGAVVAYLGYAAIATLLTRKQIRS